MCRIAAELTTVGSSFIHFFLFVWRGGEGNYQNGHSEYLYLHRNDIFYFLWSILSLEFKCKVDLQLTAKSSGTFQLGNIIGRGFALPCAPVVMLLNFNILSEMYETRTKMDKKNTNTKLLDIFLLIAVVSRTAISGPQKPLMLAILTSHLCFLDIHQSS